MNKWETTHGNGKKSCPSWLRALMHKAIKDLHFVYLMFGYDMLSMSRYRADTYAPKQI